jgi:membrane protein YqaA with SNARE-associated domain
MSHIKDRIRHWAVAHAHHPSAVWILGIVAFCESSFFPIPVDTFLVALVILNRKKWLLFGIVATVMSVIGGIAGYLVGWFLFDTVGVWLVETYQIQSQLAIVQGLYADNVFLTAFTSAFTFIPYKVFTLAGGAFKVSFIPFVVASILGRGTRFMAEAYLMHRYGAHVGKVIYRWFSLLIGVIIIAAVAAIIIL